MTWGLWSIAVGVLGSVAAVVAPGWRTATVLAGLALVVLGIIWLVTGSDTVCTSAMCERGVGAWDLVSGVFIGGPAVLVALICGLRVRSRLKERRQAAEADAFWADKGNT